MTNNQKIAEILFFTTDYGKDATVSISELKNDMSIIAKWKDNQFKKFLKKKRDKIQESYINCIFPEYKTKYYTELMLIEDIIGEFFEEK